MMAYNQNSIQLTLLILLQTIKSLKGIAINNGVTEQPKISCGTDQVSIWVQTQNPFEGKIYVKGEYGQRECSETFTGGGTGGAGTTIGLTQTSTTPNPLEPGTCPPCPPCPPPNPTAPDDRNEHSSSSGAPNNMAHLTVELGTCNLKRDRSLSPPGVTVTFTVVVSFHQHFITKVDKAYQIRCFYMEADKTVTSQIDVSMPVTTELNSQATMPNCEYTIRRDSPEGPIARFAKVGDKVYHRWECTSQNPNMFGMLVHDCYVDDGQGQRVQVINDKGCSNDRVAIGDLTYDGSLLKANVEAHVFKFADRAALEFQCAISICLTEGGGCRGVTPPRCERSAVVVVRRKRRQVLAKTVNQSSVASSPSLFDGASDNTWRLHAPSLTVVDLDDNIQEEDLKALEARFHRKRNPPNNDDFTGSIGASNSLISSQSLGSELGESVGDYYRRLLKRIGPRVCLSVVAFGALVALSTFVFTVASIVIATIYLMRKKKD